MMCVMCFAVYIVCCGYFQLHPDYDTRTELNNAILLIEFFELYGCNFNYHRVGIRIKNGGSYVPKQHLANHMTGTAPSFISIEDPVNVGQWIDFRVED